MTGLAATETGGDEVEVVVLVLAAVTRGLRSAASLWCSPGLPTPCGRDPAVTLAGSTGGIATPFIDAGKPHGDANES